MGENAGAAVLALGLALIGLGLIVMGARGTYGDVWAAVKAPAPASSSSSVGGPGGPKGGVK